MTIPNFDYIGSSRPNRDPNATSGRLDTGGMDYIGSTYRQGQDTGPTGDSEYAMPKPTPPDLISFDSLKQGIGDAARSVWDFGSSLVSPFIKQAQSYIADPASAWDFSKQTPEQAAARGQNAEGMFGAIGGGALPYGIPEAAIGSRAASGGSLGKVAATDASRMVSPFADAAQAADRMTTPIPRGEPVPFTPAPEVAPAAARPISFADLLPSRSELAANDAAAASGQQADALAARLRGRMVEITAPQPETELGARQSVAPIEAAAPTTESTLADQLAATLRSKGHPELVVGPSAPSDFVAADARLSSIHDANEAVIAAMRDAVNAPKGQENWGAVSDALQTVQELGGSVDHTLSRLRAEGLPAPTAGDLNLAKRAPVIDAAPAARATTAIERAAAEARSQSFNTVPGEPPTALKRALGSDPITGQPTRQAIFGDGIDEAVRKGLKGQEAQRYADAYLEQKAGPGGIFGERGRPTADRPLPNATGNSLDNMPITGQETIAQAKQRLADRLGVDAATGRPLAGLRPAEALTPAGVTPRPRYGWKDLGLGVEKASRAVKNVEIAASPLHFLTRHADPFMIMHPVAWAKGAGEGASTLFRSGDSAAARLEAMRNDLATRGLNPDALSSLHSGVVTGEELSSGAKISRLGPAGEVLTRTGDGFSMGLNRIRYEAMKGAADVNIPGVRPATAADKAQISDTVRIFSGKGFHLGQNAPEWQQVLARVAAVPLFTPQFLAARVRMLGETALGLGEISKGLGMAAIGKGAPISPVAIERVRLGTGHLASLAAWYGLMNMAGFKIDTNIDSSNFLRADLGPRNGFTGTLAGIAGHVGMGTIDESDGHVHLDIGGPEAPLVRAVLHTWRNFATGAREIDGSPKAAGPMVDMMTNQLGPGFSQVAKLLTGKHVDFITALLPMWASDAAQSSGWNPPTIKLGAARDYKNDRPADIVWGPTPSPAPRSIPIQTPQPQYRLPAAPTPRPLTKR